MLMNFRILSVRDVDKPNSKSEKFGYREGRVCKIDTEYMIVGCPLIVHYLDGKYFRTSTVTKINKDRCGFEVKTRNRIYYFEHFIKKI